MDKTLRLNELYKKIMVNRRSDMSDEQFNLLLNDLYMMGFNEGADQYNEMSKGIASEIDLMN